MISIILSLFLAFILVTRSIESVVTNEILLAKIESFHHKVKKYINKVTSTTFNTASTGILTDSLKYVVWFFGIIYIISMLIFGIAIKTGNTNSAFISQELNYIPMMIFIPVLLSFGLKINFSTFFGTLKTDVSKIAKHPLVWIFLTLYYSLIFTFYFLAITVSQGNLNYVQTISRLFKNEGSLCFLFLPILLLITFILFKFFSWAICRLTAYFSYHILKYIFIKSQDLNSEKPLKPLLLIIQTISLITPPIIVFINGLLF